MCAGPNGTGISTPGRDELHESPISRKWLKQSGTRVTRPSENKVLRQPQRAVPIRFMLPMHAQKRKGAPMNLDLNTREGRVTRVPNFSKMAETVRDSCNSSL